MFTIMVDVFTKTIQEPNQAQRVLSTLRRVSPGVKITIDLDQCENILRVKGPQFDSARLIVLVNQAGFRCEVMEDKICLSNKPNTKMNERRANTL